MPERTDDWIDTFVAQLEALDLDNVVKWYALRRAAQVARSRGRDDDLYARELLQDVLNDTFEGQISWDPSRVTLRQHVLDAMQSRSRHDCIRAQRFPHYSVDDQTWLAAAENALAESSADDGNLATETLRQLRTLADEDPDVIALLSAYDHGITKKVHVLRFTELTHLRYDAARNRLKRLRDELPQYLRATARGRRN